MNRVDLSKVPNYLRQQRWFGGKASPIQNVHLIDHLELPTTSRGAVPILAIVEVVYAMGAKERYLMPVIPGPHGELQEALLEPEVAQVVLDFVREGRSVRSASGSLKAFCMEPKSPLISDLPGRPSVRMLSGEQSNTSIVFGERVLLKILRKLEPGASLELEVGRFLCTRTDFRSTPILLGAVELEGTFASTLAVVHQFIPDSEDGWTWCLREMPKPDAQTATLAEVGKLGTLTGQLHVALASDATEPAFSPEPILPEDLQRWSSSIIGELGVTLAHATPLFPDAGDLREPLLGRAHLLAELSHPGQQIRIHGDLHLGQALRGEGAWWIYDFEGEPARPIDQRREKHSPMRDVAGMVRSFDYAAAVAKLDEATHRKLARAYQQAFIQGYREATRGQSFLPEDEAAFMGMLDVFVLEKALYEVRYELQSRPEWAKIPFGYLRDLVGGNA
jgi:trehalose synthase-fused probable maltokinase